MQLQRRHGGKRFGLNPKDPCKILRKVLQISRISFTRLRNRYQQLSIHYDVFCGRSLKSLHKILKNISKILKILFERFL